MSLWTHTITLEVWFCNKLFEFTAMTIAILIGQMWIHKKYIISLNRTFTILYKIIQKKCSSVIKVCCDREESKNILCTMHAQSLSLDHQQSFFRPSCIARNVSFSLSLLQIVARIASFLQQCKQRYHHQMTGLRASLKTAMAVTNK